MAFKMKSPFKKSIAQEEIKIEKPVQRRTKKQIRQEDRAERKATRKSEGSIARQALRRGVNKVKAAVSKKKSTPTFTSRRIEAPKATSKPGVVKPTVKKTIKKVQTKRGTGNTYKAVWDADKGNVKSKYKNFEAFRKAAVAYNSRKDSKGVMKSDANKIGPKNKK